MPSSRSFRSSTVFLLLAIFFGVVVPISISSSQAFASTCTLSGAGTGASPWLVSNAADLAKVGVSPCTLSGHYEQTADIVLTAPAAGQSNHTPIGVFTGVYNGSDKSISNLTVVATAGKQGMFSEVSGSLSEVKNVILENVSIKTSAVSLTGVAGLVGLLSSDAKVSNSHVLGGEIETTNGGTFGLVGGLIGEIARGQVLSSSSSAAVTNRGPRTGGLVGAARNPQTSISDSHATGPVQGNSRFTGGLVGELDSGATISRSYATGNVNQTTTATPLSDQSDGVGGLVGGFRGTGGAITDSYATGDVTLNAVGAGVAGVVGGLVGFLGSTATVDRSYSTGTVTGPPISATVRVEGLIGFQGTASTTGPTLTDGNRSTISDSFWDTQTSGRATSAGGTGKTTAQMTSIATFNAVATGLVTPWDIVDAWEPSAPTATPKRVWGICDVDVAPQFGGYPYLLWQSTSDPCAVPTSNNVGPSGATSGPRIHLDLQAKSGDRAAGAPILIEGQGLKPGSTYSLILRSTPVTVKTAQVSSGGTFSKTVNMPSAIAPGTHTITLTAIGLDGSTLSLVTTFVVSSAGTVTSISQGVGTVVGGLAATGPNSSLLSWGLAASLALLLLGLMAFVPSRWKVARVI